MDFSLCDLRFRRTIKHLHSLGPRALAEFIIDVEKSDRSAARLKNLLAIYERISPDTIKLIGGADFPPLPMHIASERDDG